MISDKHVFQKQLHFRDDCCYNNFGVTKNVKKKKTTMVTYCHKKKLSRLKQPSLKKLQKKVRNRHTLQGCSSCVHGNIFCRRSYYLSLEKTARDQVYLEAQE